MRLEDYYNKFNEDKRLDSLRGQVEYLTAMKYIHDYLNNYEHPSIVDIGAGTGKYSCTLANEGYDVTAIELCKTNLGVLKAKKSNCKAFLGNALDLSGFKDESFDMTLLFGPLYHLHRYEDKVEALKEAKRVTKEDGVILVSYINNDYAIVEHGFREGHIKESLSFIDENWKINESGNELYSYVRKEDIDLLNHDAGLYREKIIAEDSISSLIRENLKKLSDEEFTLFMKYHFAICERADMLGNSFHFLDILRKEQTIG